MKKKLTAMFLAASAALAPALCATTNKVSYYDPTDPASPHKEVDCTLVTGTTTTLTQGWYAVNADVTMTGRITVSGSGVHLILCDGATLNATNGVRLAASNSLTIYGQRQGTGALFALRPANYCAGIGGNDQENGGTLTVNGGWMKVWGGQYGAAIGGGCAADGGKLVVNGGTIIAEGYNGSAAIGGGDDGSGGEVEINGGHVTAIGSSRSTTRQAAAGIGAGRPKDNSPGPGTVKITGGTVIAVAGTAQVSGNAAQAIGVNLANASTGTDTLTLGHMMVFSPTNAATPCAVSNRTVACRQTGSVRIESCTHEFENDTCSWCGIVIPSVSNVVARQRWPWNGLVDITCTVSGIDGTVNGLEFAVAAVMNSGDVHNATHLWTVRDGKKSASRNVSTNGNYHLLWDAGAYFGMGEIHSNVVVSVTVVKERAKVQLWEGGPYWATTNIGAESPEDYGYYFWWGDTVGYKWENEKWVASNGSSSNFSFEERNAPTCGKDLATLQREGWITAEGVLSPDHDAAHVHWGGAWRMPTRQELDDLVNKCNWNETTLNGVNGWTVTGRDAYESASIFLPCAGGGYGASLYTAGSYGYYWSSVPTSDDYNAWYLGFTSGYHGTSTYGRSGGQSVRPVQGFTE